MHYNPFPAHTHTHIHTHTHTHDITKCTTHTISQDVHVMCVGEGDITITLSETPNPHVAQTACAMV